MSGSFDFVFQLIFCLDSNIQKQSGLMFLLSIHVFDFFHKGIQINTISHEI